MRGLTDEECTFLVACLPPYDAETSELINDAERDMVPALRRRGCLEVVDHEDHECFLTTPRGRVAIRMHNLTKMVLA